MGSIMTGTKTTIASSNPYHVMVAITRQIITITMVHPLVTTATENMTVTTHLVALQWRLVVTVWMVWIMIWTGSRGRMEITDADWIVDTQNGTQTAT